MAKHRPKRGRIRVADLSLVVAAEDCTRSLQHLDAVIVQFVEELVQERDGHLAH